MKALAALCLIWAGLVAGISFLETPVKFTAPSVILAIGLDVGRHVFGALNKVEIAAAILAVTILLRLRPSRALMFKLLAVAAIVALQSAWLLPTLDARVTQILAGQQPPPAPFHWIYIGLELVKLILLLSAGWSCLDLLPGQNTANNLASAKPN